MTDELTDDATGARDTPFSATDHRHMATALRLAERGLWTTQPNPHVGCVIAHGEDVVGQGWHHRAGQAHAEVLALEEAGQRARGATVYVTLEPCGMYGRTPPCADALIAAHVARVVMASADVNQQYGGALQRLHAAGIVVQMGLMRDAARELNRGFFSRVERGRPWLRVKLAMSVDGRTALADGESKWISGDDARADVQRWRARSSALLTGSGTLRADNPHLTVRIPETGSSAFVPPTRVVLDTGLATSAGANVLDDAAPTLFLHAANARHAQHFDAVETATVEMHGRNLDLVSVLALLGERGCNEVQVEAGATLAGALVAQNLIDELLLYIAPVLLGDDARPLLHLPSLAQMSDRPTWRTRDTRQVGRDLRLLLRPAATGNADTSTRAAH